MGFEEGEALEVEVEDEITAALREGVEGVLGTGLVVVAALLATEGAVLMAEAVLFLIDGAIEGALLAALEAAVDEAPGVSLVKVVEDEGKGGDFVPVGVFPPRVDTRLRTEVVVDALTVRDLASGGTGASSRLTLSRTDVIPVLTVRALGTGGLGTGGSTLGPTGFLTDAVVEAEAVRSLLGPAEELVDAVVGRDGFGLALLIVDEAGGATDLAVRVVFTLVSEGEGDDLPLRTGASGIGRVGLDGWVSKGLGGPDMDLGVRV